MRIIPGTIADPAYCAELERRANEAEAEAAWGSFAGAPEALEAGAPVEITRRSPAFGDRPALHDEVVAIADRVQAVFQNPGVDALGVVVTDSLYTALGALTFVADVAEEAGL